MFKILKRLFPKTLKRKIKKFLLKMKEPNMIYGYLNYDGAYKSRTRISDTVYFYHKEKVNIADNVFIWHYTILDGTGGITIEEGCQIGAWVGIFTHSSHIAIRIYGKHYQEILENEKKGYIVSPVKIGKYSSIAAGSAIMPGVTIGKGVIVSVGSVVKRNVPDFAVVSGNPAKIVGDARVLDKEFLDDPILLKWYEEWQK